MVFQRELPAEIGYRGFARVWFITSFDPMDQRYLTPRAKVEEGSEHSPQELGFSELPPRLVRTL
jgi:hypothetical protein